MNFVAFLARRGRISSDQSVDARKQRLSVRRQRSPQAVELAFVEQQVLDKKTVQRESRRYRLDISEESLVAQAS